MFAHIVIQNHTWYVEILELNSSWRRKYENSVHIQGLVEFKIISAYHDKKLTGLSARLVTQIYCNDVSANRIEPDLNDREDKIWKGSQ